MNATTVELGGWGHAPVRACRVAQPGRTEEIAAALAEGPLLARGLGRSYGDAALNAQGLVLDLRGMALLRSFDPASGRLWCEAGVTLDALIRWFAPRGWFPPVVPGTKYVTVGGALASDVHGKNHHHDGAISASVRTIELLVASGEVVQASRERHADLFWATLGGMGLTGVILAAELELRPIETTWLATRTVRCPDFDALLAALNEHDDTYRHSVAWMDIAASPRRLGRGVLMLGNHAEAASLRGRRAARPLAVPRQAAVAIPWRPRRNWVRSWAVDLFNRLYYMAHRSGAGQQHVDPFFFPLDGLRHWNRLYGRPGFVQYQLVVPPERAREALLEVFAAVRRYGRSSFLSVLKRMGAEGGPLGFPMPGLTLTLDFPVIPELAPFLDGLDEIVLRHGGRVYLTKDSRLRPDVWRAMQPRWREWQAVKDAWDPEHRFASELARRLELV